ncbi:MAG: hypothetical protein R3E72_13105, partial [Steroidobacteraceae bacterium]
MGATNIRMAVLVTVVGVTLAAQLVATPVLAQDPIRPAGAGDVLPACADQPGRYDGIEQPTLNSRTCSLPPGPTARLLSAQ